MRSVYRPEFSVKKNFNDETKLWWESAQMMLDMHPDSCPDAIAPLFDKSINEEEVLVSRSELKEIQAWAVGLPGWDSSLMYGPLIFERK